MALCLRPLQEEVGHDRCSSFTRRGTVRIHHGQVVVRNLETYFAFTFGHFAPWRVFVLRFLVIVFGAASDQSDRRRGQKKARCIDARAKASGNPEKGLTGVLAGEVVMRPSFRRRGIVGSEALPN